MSQLSKFLLTASLLTGVAALADFSGSYVVPIDHEAIQYARPSGADLVAQLQKGLTSGESQLAFDLDGSGYLRSVLQALKVPVTSQVLVFSKTSFQAPRIAPRLPRALYFNDQVSVGWVRGGDVLELAALDPRQGVVFYTLDQEEAGVPKLQRSDACLQCHASGSTAGVPGLLVRSVFPDPTGMPLFQAGSFSTDYRSPLHERWGGWYVSGTHGAQRHMGNAVVENRATPDQLNARSSQNITDLSGRFDTGAYPTPHSDIVALMVLEHQVRMTNLLIRAGWETRMALHQQEVMNSILKQPAGQPSESTVRRIRAAAEAVVEALLFSQEAPLEGAIKGTSGFTEEFSARGPRDRKGRSLREFDLDKRLFRYPCSYMIYSEAFDQLPEALLVRIRERLHEVLAGTTPEPNFKHLSTADKSAIVQILQETKPSLRV